jgi:predicted SnoaL-like aldol condensation-catalyzing enzyme
VNNLKLEIKVGLIMIVIGLVSIGSGTNIISIQQSSAQEQDSSQEEGNKALVSAFFNDVYDNRNVSALTRYIADTFTTSDGIDKEAFIANISAVLNSFPDLTRSLDNIVAEGDLVVTFNTWNGTFSGEDYRGIPANDIPIVAATADLFRISDGQILEHWQIGDYSNFTQALFPKIIEALQP